MASYDLTEVHKVTGSDEATSSIFFNRSIDWEDKHPTGARGIVDLSIFSVGLFLNIVVLITMLAKPRMHTSVGCYVLSLTVSNFVILLNVLDDVVRDLFAIDIKLDIDFVGRVTLQSSSMTLVIFALDRYIAICRKGSDWHRSTKKVSTAAKGVLVIWSFATVATAMELHLYEHFRTRTIINIFCWSTAMYVLLPTIVILLLSALIAMEILENREIEVSKRAGNDLVNLRLFAGLTLSFYVTMVPQRIATILYYKEPQICCSPMIMNVCYYLPKVSTVVGPTIFIGTLKSLRRSVKETLLCAR